MTQSFVELELDVNLFPRPLDPRGRSLGMRQAEVLVHNQRRLNASRDKTGIAKLDQQVVDQLFTATGRKQTGDKVAKVQSRAVRRELDLRHLKLSKLSRAQRKALDRVKRGQHN